MRIPSGEVVLAYGYDDALMPRGRVLHGEELDADFPGNSVIAQHVSLHGAVLKSAARKWGITAEIPTPPGDRLQGGLERARRADDEDRFSDGVRVVARTRGSEGATGRVAARAASVVPGAGTFDTNNAGSNGTAGGGTVGTGGLGGDGGIGSSVRCRLLWCGTDRHVFALCEPCKVQ